MNKFIITILCCMFLVGCATTKQGGSEGKQWYQKTWVKVVGGIGGVLVLREVLDRDKKSSDSPPAADMSKPMQCRQVAEIRGLRGGVFTLEPFKQQLHIGMYDISSRSKDLHWKYSGNNVRPGNLKQSQLRSSESLCDMKEFRGHLYASTENRGELFRSANGQDWLKVRGFDGQNKVGCALEAHGNKLYAAISVPSNGPGNVVSSSDGKTWRKVGGNLGYVRELTSHKGTLHAFSVLNGRPKWYTLSGGGWVDNSGLLGGRRAFRATSIGNDLWIGFSNTFAGGVTGLGRFRPGGKVQMLDVRNNFTHFNDPIMGTRNGGNIVFVGAGAGFKPNSSRIGKLGGGAVFAYRQNGQKAGRVCSFPKEEGVWGTAKFRNSIYFGTMRGGPGTGDSVGRVYVLDGVKAL